MVLAAHDLGRPSTAAFLSLLTSLSVLQVRPLGVDVSSGVESLASGTAKDPAMVQSFVANAKSAM